MKQVRKSMLTLLALVVSLSALLAACSGGNESAAPKDEAPATKTETATKEPAVEEPKEKVELDFWTFWGSEVRRPIIEKIVDDFNKSQDRIVVKHTFLPWGDVWTKNLAAIAAGNPPDVIVNDINSVATRAVNKQVTDITKYVDAANIKGDFYPELWNTVVHEDKVYGIPFDTDTRLLFYNKDAFKDAGLDPEKPPTTWAELEEYAIKLDKKNGDRYERIGFYPLWGNWGWDNWMMNADGGVGFLDKEGNVTINTPKKVEALKWVNKWTERLGDETVNAFKAEFGNKQADPFISGKVAMILQTGTFYTQLRDYGQDVNFGIAAVPENEPGSGHYSSGGGFVMEIPQGAKNPDASWEFLKFLGGVQAQKHWAVQNFANVPNIEAAESAAKDPALTDTGKYVYGSMVKNLEVTKMFPVPAFAPDYRSLVNPQADAALLGDTSPENALKQAQADVESLIKQNKK
jgi:multiple sugar transport system substrate-binding protein